MALQPFHLVLQILGMILDTMRNPRNVPRRLPLHQASVLSVQIALPGPVSLDLLECAGTLLRLAVVRIFSSLLISFG